MEIEGWLAKDHDGRVCFFLGDRPKNVGPKERPYFVTADSSDGSDCLTQITIDDDDFPDLPAGQYCPAKIFIMASGVPKKPATK